MLKNCPAMVGRYKALDTLCLKGKEVNRGEKGKAGIDGRFASVAFKVSWGRAFRIGADGARHVPA
jgi:hypothetical protein